MRVYEQMYHDAKLPLPNELIGTWDVTILSGPIPNMRRIGHVKVIRPQNAHLAGYNRTLLIFRWGRFTVTFSADSASFRYGKVRFFDRVRKVEEGLLIGQYKFINDAGEVEHGGYFKMQRR